MPRWILPAVVVGDVVVVSVLYAVLGWPAVIVGVPLVICSVVVLTVLTLTGSRGPAPFLVDSFVRASGHPRGPAGPGGSGGHGDDDWCHRTHGHTPSDHEPFSSSADPGGSPSWSDPGAPSWSDPGCTWSDSGPSSSDNSSGSSDSGSCSDSSPSSSPSD